jgi:S1-C subfamily serine protease
MLDDTGAEPSLRRRGSGNMLTHTVMAVLGAALAAGLLLAFDNPGPAARASRCREAAWCLLRPRPPRWPAASRPSSPRVEPGLVIINTALQYNSEAAAGTGMVINADGLVLTNNHVIDDSTKVTATVAATGRTYPPRSSATTRPGTSP